MFNARRALSVSFTLAELPHDGFRPLYTALYIENKSCNTLLFYDALASPYVLAIQYCIAPSTIACLSLTLSLVMRPPLSGVWP